MYGEKSMYSCCRLIHHPFLAQLSFHFSGPHVGLEWSFQLSALVSSLSSFNCSVNLNSGLHFLSDKVNILVLFSQHQPAGFLGTQVKGQTTSSAIIQTCASWTRYITYQLVPLFTNLRKDMLWPLILRMLVSDAFC